MEHCEKVEGWADIDGDSDHWKFTVEGASMNGTVYRKAYKAITDTGKIPKNNLLIVKCLGTSIIVAPGKIVRIFAAVKQKYFERVNCLTTLGAQSSRIQSILLFVV